MRTRKIIFYSEGWGLGGIERFVVNAIDALNPGEYTCDVFCTHDWSDCHDAKIEQHGGKRYTVFRNHRPNLLKRYLTSPCLWKNLLETNRYDIAHINIMNGAGLLYANIAKECRIPVRIVHAHNSSFSEGSRLAKTAVHECGKSLYGNSPTVRLAVSNEAGRFIFGRHPFQVLNNFVNPDDFRFDPSARKTLRSMYGIPNDALVIGTVSRLSEAKNPLFQVELLHKIRSEYGTDVYLLLAGDGPLRNDILKRADTYDLLPRIILPGPTNNPRSFLSMLDVMTLPSLFEGSPFATLESLANGLPCIISSRIPSLGEEPPRLIRLDLDDTNLWAKAALSTRDAFPSERRPEGTLLTEEYHFDAASNIQQLVKFYER